MLNGCQHTFVFVSFVPLQAFNRIDDVNGMFYADNTMDRSDIVPLIVHAPLGSGKSTILELGARIQPHTLLCTMRAADEGKNSKSDDHQGTTTRTADEKKFVSRFTRSLGLVERGTLANLAVWCISQLGIVYFV